MIPESIPPTDIDEGGEQLRPKWRRKRRIVQGYRRIIERGGADIDACAAPRQPRGRYAGVLAGFEDELEQQALLRIDLFGLTRRNAEHARIETPNVVQNAGRPGIASPSFLGLWMPKSALRPPICGNARDCAMSPFEQLPEARDVGSAREAAGSADDRNIFSRVSCIVAQSREYLPMPKNCLAL